MVETLLNAGADINAIDKDGKNVLDYAKLNEKLKGTEALKKLTEEFYQKGGLII